MTDRPVPRADMVRVRFGDGRMANYRVSGWSPERLVLTEDPGFELLQSPARIKHIYFPLTQVNGPLAFTTWTDPSRSSVDAWPMFQ